MQSFKSFISSGSTVQPLSEAFKMSSLTQVDKLVSKYMARKLKTDLMRMPGVEQFTNSKDSGFGVRFFLTPAVRGIDSIRFNWYKKQLDTAAVASVDLFKEGKNTNHLAFEYGTSMVKVLPFIVDFITSGSNKTGTMKFLNEGTTLSTLYNLNEATDSFFVRLAKTLDGMGELPASKGKMYSTMKSHFKDEKPTTSNKIFEWFEENAPQYIEKVGRRTKLDYTPEVAQKFQDKLSADIFNTVKVSSGGSNETYVEEPEVEEMAAQGLERLSFEQQLEDMRQAVRYLYTNVTNSVFIGGRGGIGKTHNVEETLGELGLEDGNGYFKNAGSISASGLYRLLYRHRDSLILFDDSDNVFGDQEARNVLKGATDTKPVRKLSWAKKSSDIVQADDFSDDDEEEGKVPSYFEFTGKILFISNLPMDKLDPDGALRTRGFIVEINPTDEEVYEFMKKIASKIPLPDGLTITQDQIDEVVEAIKKSPRKPNLRMLVRALKIRAATKPGADWERFVTHYA